VVRNCRGLFSKYSVLRAAEANRRTDNMYFDQDFNHESPKYVAGAKDRGYVQKPSISLQLARAGRNVSGQVVGMPAPYIVSPEL
jgi:hypothetical protein